MSVIAPNLLHRYGNGTGKTGTPAEGRRATGPGKRAGGSRLPRRGFSGGGGGGSEGRGLAARRAGGRPEPHNQPALEAVRPTTRAAAGAMATGCATPAGAERRPEKGDRFRAEGEGDHGLAASFPQLRLASTCCSGTWILFSYLYVVPLFQRKIDGLGTPVSAKIDGLGTPVSASKTASMNRGVMDGGGIQSSRWTGAIRGGLGCSTREPGGVR